MRDEAVGKTPEQQRPCDFCWHDADHDSVVNTTLQKEIDDEDKETTSCAGPTAARILLPKSTTRYSYEGVHETTERDAL